MNLSGPDVQNIYSYLHVLGSRVDQVNFFRGQGSVGFRQRSSRNMRGREKKKIKMAKTATQIMFIDVCFIRRQTCNV